jgi:hypothetical protein
MLQMEGQTTVAKGGAQRMSPERNQRYRKNRGHPGANVIWRRLNDNIDELVIRTGTNPALVSVVSRLVLFGHLTREEGEIARYYGEIIKRFRRFNGELPDTPRAQVYDRGSPGSGNEIEKRERDGTIVGFERQAKRARKMYDRVQKVLLPYIHARDVLDDICVHEKEVNSSHYPSIKAMLALLATEFGLENRHQGNNNARNKPSKKDIRMMVDSAIRLITSTADGR